MVHPGISGKEVGSEWPLGLPLGCEQRRGIILVPAKYDAFSLFWLSGGVIALRKYRMNLKNPRLVHHSPLFTLHSSLSTIHYPLLHMQLDHIHVLQHIIAFDGSPGVDGIAPDPSKFHLL